MSREKNSPILETTHFFFQDKWLLLWLLGSTLQLFGEVLMRTCSDTDSDPTNIFVFSELVTVMISWQ